MKVMLDLETLSSNSNAAVVAVGAVVFDEQGLPSIPKFYRAVTISSLDKAGLHISASTFAWWCQQSDAARGVFTDKAALPLVEVLKEFSNWCRGFNLTEMWGNGADFDCVILGHAYEAVGLYRPWKYGQNRCFRTLRSLIPVEKANEAWEKWALGTHHNALDDAVRQANIAVDCYRIIRGG